MTKRTELFFGFRKCHFVLFIVFLISLSGNCADTNSILDEAASSSEFAHKLINQYESSSNTFTEERLLAVGIAYIGEDNYERARPVYERFLQDHPDYTRALRGLGTVNLFQQRSNDAVKCYAKAWSKGDLDSLGPLAALYASLGRFKEMEGLIPALKEHAHSDPLMPLSLIAYALSKDPPREDLILDALDGIPDNQIFSRDDMAQELAIAADRLMALDENNKTLRAICKKIINGYVEDTNAWPKKVLNCVGDAYSQIGDYTNAERIYQQVLVNQPDSPSTLTSLGSMRVLQHRFPEGIAYLRKALSLGERKALARLSGAYLASRDLDGMKDLIPSLLELKGENLELLNSLIGYALMKSPMDKELFYKALQDVSDDQILRRNDTTDAVLQGMKLFGDEDHVIRLLKMKQEQDKGLRG